MNFAAGRQPSRRNRWQASCARFWRPPKIGIFDASRRTPPCQLGGRDRVRQAEARCMAYSVAMRSELFDFELPPERIALEPVSPRDRARLLIVRPDGEGARPAAPSFAD